MRKTGSLRAPYPPPAPYLRKSSYLSTRLLHDIVPRTKEYSTCNVRILEIPLALVHVKSIISLV